MLGVDAVRGIFCRRPSTIPFRLRMSLTDVADPWVRPRFPLGVQSALGLTISVPPMVTCFFGGPPGYRAAMWPSDPPKPGSHEIPRGISNGVSSRRG